jgi:hypothetical protein
MRGILTRHPAKPTVPEPSSPESSDEVKRRPWLAILLVVVATALAIWLVPSDDIEVVDLPPPPQTPMPEPATGEAPPVASAPAGTPPATGGDMPVDGTPGSTARRLIAAQRSAGEIDPQAAYEEARRLAAIGMQVDAYLLDFYAARLGHGVAAFRLAEQADPAFWQADSPLKAAAPEQAFKWYQSAREAGHPQAAERLSALRRWTQDAASKGDAQAQRLMLLWQ